MYDDAKGIPWYSVFRTFMFIQLHLESLRIEPTTTSRVVRVVER